MEPVARLELALLTYQVRVLPLNYTGNGVPGGIRTHTLLIRSQAPFQLSFRDVLEQYFEFARDLADSYIVMDRGEVVLSGQRSDMVETDVRRYLTV